MSIAFNSNELLALQSSMKRVGVFFKLYVEPNPIRLWAGVGQVLVVPNAFDEVGATYTGFGELRNVPAFESLINGVASRVSFTLAGTAITQNIINSAASEAQTVINAQCVLGVGLFDMAWQQLGSIKWLRRGWVDYLTLSDQDGGRMGRIRSIEISVRSLFTGRRRRGLSFLTDADQQRRFPGDKACERTVLYAGDVDKVWPVLTS